MLHIVSNVMNSVLLLFDIWNQILELTVRTDGISSSRLLL